MPRLEYACDTCGTAVERGAIYIPYRDFQAAEKALAEWTRQEDATIAHLSEHDTSWMFTLPGPPEVARWRVGCNACAGTCEGAYWIEIDQVRHWTGLLRWTEHLSGKNWYPATDWMALLKRIAEANELPTVARRAS